MKVGTFEGKDIYISESLEKKLNKKQKEGYKKIIINKNNIKTPKTGAILFLNNWSGKDKLNYCIWLAK